MLSIKKLQEEIQQFIKEHPYSKYPHELYDPLDYMMALGGKRIRPIMVLLGHGIYSEDTKHALPAAICVEVFHNFSLIHDDIMDEAPLRRGQETVHQKWNHNTAILSGDVMLVKAYELLLHYDKNQLHSLLSLLNKTAIEVCEGQQIDMMFEKMLDVTLDDYLKMIELKTAVLLACSLKMGAIIANASENDANNLYEYGRLMGIAFQLRDDYLDVYADPSKFGKQVGGDILSNKKTYLLIEALNNSNLSQKEVLKHWLSLKDFNPSEKIQAITNIYNELDIPNHIQKKIESFAAEANKHLDEIKGNKEVIDLLKSISSELLVREN